MDLFVCVFDELWLSVLPLVVESLCYLELFHARGVEYVKDFMESAPQEGSIHSLCFGNLEVKSFDGLVEVLYAVDKQRLINADRC